MDPWSQGPLVNPALQLNDPTKQFKMEKTDTILQKPCNMIQYQKQAINNTLYGNTNQMLNKLGTACHDAIAYNTQKLFYKQLYHSVLNEYVFADVTYTIAFTNSYTSITNSLLKKLIRTVNILQGTYVHSSKLKTSF